MEEQTKDKNENWKYKIGETLNQKLGKIVLLEKEIRIKNYASTKNGGKCRIKRQKWYQYKCLKCEYIGWVQQSDLNKGVGCSCCSNMIVVKGINDVATTDPDLIKYFVNKKESERVSVKSYKKVKVMCLKCGKTQEKSVFNLRKSLVKCDCENLISNKRPDLISFFKNKENASIYTIGTHKKDIFVCPNCKMEKEMIVKDFVQHGFACQRCTDGISFGEKYFRSFLEQSEMKYVYQFSRKNAEWCDKYRYDFQIPGLKLIVEINGIQHYKPRFGYFGDMSLEQQQKVDEIKRQLAIGNGFEYLEISVMRNVGCDIKEQIERSGYFKKNVLSKIDWNRCIVDATSSIKYEICKEYENNPEIGISGLVKKYQISERTVRTYLRDGASDGFCNYNL